MKKFLALILALTLAATLVACGGRKNDKGDKEEKEEETNQLIKFEDDTIPVQDVTMAETLTFNNAEIESVMNDFLVDDEEEYVTQVVPTSVPSATKAPSTTKAPSATSSSSMSKEAFVNLYNSETAKIVKSGKYSFNRTCSYISSFDVGDAKETLNKIISAIDQNSTLDTVVGDYLGIGTKRGVLPKDKLNETYKLKAGTLKASDLENFTVSGGTYSFTLSNASNPKKNGATAFSRFTNDFITHEEIVDDVASITTLIKLNSSTINYKKITVKVQVANGKITSIKYSYDFDAQLAINAVVTINGTGSARVSAEYSGFSY